MMNKQAMSILLALCIIMALPAAVALSEKEYIPVENEVPRVGPYSQMIRAGGFVFCSAQAAFDPATGKLVEGGIAEQTKQILSNFSAELKDAGLTLDDVVDVIIYMTDITMFSQMNEVYAGFFSEPYPARACVEVSGLPVEGALLTIKVIALAKESTRQTAVP